MEVIARCSARRSLRPSITFLVEHGRQHVKDEHVAVRGRRTQLSQAELITKYDILGPMPGSASSPSSVLGMSPPCCSSSSLLVL